LKHSLFRAALLSSVFLFSGFSAQAEGLPGSYLAARSASTAADFDEAAAYFSRALMLDPTNAFLMDNASASFLSLGKIESAIPISKALNAQGVNSPIADLVLAADEIAREDYTALIERLEDGAQVGPIVTELMAAWAQLGAGKMSSAVGKFDALASQPGIEGIGRFHKALALASVGDFEAAEEIFAKNAEEGFSHTRTTLRAHIEILSQMERNDDALVVLDAVFPDGGGDPEFEEIKTRLEAGETLPFEVATNARQGIAQAALTLAEVLSVEAAPDQTLLYSRVAEYLDPRLVSATLLSAAMLEELEQFDLAERAYSKVPADHPSYHLAEIGRAETLRLDGRPEAAVEVLQALAKRRPDLAAVEVSLGDLLRSEKEYGGAVEAYDAALALFPRIEPNQWFIFYARGISHERLNDFEAAEADFRKALDLNPGQPQVLNYLGYSLVEKNIKLDEALEMIEAAVAARPEDGYIIDSLAWVYFKLERYEEAATLMEKAALLEPLDPIVSDHLGDALWMVDRKIEADFQWRRALSFEPEEKDAERIRLKLELGLDVVRQNEAAADN
jgi:tetratricopeptide (TPR) repeat protein